ncbi:MAG TPA: hypothetical protein VGJ86_15485 [Acidimicrobiales bacterium]
MQLTDRQDELCRTATTDFSDLRAVFINCSLKRSPEVSNTQGLADISMEIMRRLEVTVDPAVGPRSLPCRVQPETRLPGQPRRGWPFPGWLAVPCGVCRQGPPARRYSACHNSAFGRPLTAHRGR